MRVRVDNRRNDYHKLRRRRSYPVGLTHIRKDKEITESFTVVGQRVGEARSFNDGKDVIFLVPPARQPCSLS